MLVILIGYDNEGKAVAGDIYQAENDRDAVAKALESESVLFGENVDGWRAFEYRDDWGPGREVKATPEDYTTDAHIKRRLEDLRKAIRAENISYGELAELQSLAEHIEPGDVELLEWAGVPEFPEDNDA